MENLLKFENKIQVFRLFDRLFIDFVNSGEVNKKKFSQSKILQK